MTGGRGAADIFRVRPSLACAAGLAVALVTAWLPALPATAAAATAPSAEAAVPPQVAQAIRQLGDPSFDRREQATEVLWTIGDAAEDALRRAAAGPDPEIASRAKLLLERIELGILPRTPEAVIELATRYAQADDDGKLAVLNELVGQGSWGYLVLTSLARHERDGVHSARIRALLQAKTPHVENMVRTLILAGRAEAAERMLADAVVDAGGEHVLRARAAFHACRGTLDAEIRKLSAAAPDRRAALQLAYFCRAAGDLPAATRWARAAHDDWLTESLCLEAGDWAGYAEQLRSDVTAADASGGARGASLARCALLAIAQRLAGDESAAAATLDRVRRGAAEQRPDRKSRPGDAVVLLLAGCPREAIELEVRQQRIAPAFIHLTHCDDYAAALALLDRPAAAADPIEADDALAPSAMRLLHLMGRRQQLLEFRRRLLVRAEQEPTFDRWSRVHLADCELGLKDDAREHAARALSLPAGTDARADAAWLEFFVREFGSARGAVVARWWPVVRDIDPAAPLPTMQALAERRLPPDLLHRLAAAAEEQAAGTPNDLRAGDAWMQRAADALEEGGLADEAAALRQRLDTARRERGDFAALADRALVERDFAAAADSYAKALAAEDSSAGAAAACRLLFLRGVALSGVAVPAQQALGRQLMAQASTAALADPAARQALARAAQEQGLPDEARSQRRLACRTAEPRSWDFFEASRELANDASTRQDYATAAHGLQCFALEILDRGGLFVKPEAYVELPLLVRRFRARALLAAIDVPGAMRELRACLAAAPARVQLATEFVPLLDAAGHRAEADALFTAVYDALAARVAQFPDSAHLRNELAWTGATCHRRLDEALAEATRAVALEPSNPSYLDTLAEVHFHQGRRQPAVELARKARALRPDEELWAKRLNRFETDPLPTGATPEP